MKSHVLASVYVLTLLLHANIFTEARTVQDGKTFRFSQTENDARTRYQPQQRLVFNRFENHEEEAQPEPEPPKCGYESCNLGKPGMLNVHLVAHTHDDVGWLKTVDQYYYGARNDIAHAGVQYILDTVIDELLKDPNKKFIYVEIAFFYRWWLEQSDYMRHQVKALVNEGRLEFILGGWCMNDEAATHYNAMIDQHTLGFHFLEKNFGDCARPKIGWQIDPFGHSREQASMFAQFGFDGLFFGRLDYQDKDKRLKTKTMEHMWMGSSSLGDQATLFTGVNYNGYGPPDGFCFDRGCTDQPIMDDDRLEDYNVDERVDALLKAAHDQAAHYTTDHIMFTMGSDFQYENAHMNFKQLDKLIRYVNARNNTNVYTFYSTPSCYLYALNKANQSYTSKKDDFFPYASDAHEFWTGYFTSRPALKRYVRYTNNFLQVVKQLDTLSQLEAEYGSNIKLFMLQEAMGVAQHHDAVSGTEKQAVAYDYAFRLARGITECEDVVNYAYEKLMSHSSTKPPQQIFCHSFNVSSCPTTEDYNSFTVVVYNPLARSISQWVRLPVVGSAFTVLTGNMTKVPAQIVPLSSETKAIPGHHGSKATNELVFQVTAPPVGFHTYFVQKSNDIQLMAREATDILPQSNDEITIKNEHVSLSFDTNGLLSGMTNLDNKLTVNVKQSLMYYESADGNGSKPEFQASGAYVFRPKGEEPHVIESKIKTYMTKGDLVQEVHQIFSPWASQVVRLHHDSHVAEIEYTVGPIPYQDKIGREVISRFETNLATDGTFYTDANGREVLKRVRDYRPTWTLNQTEPVAGNYYPVNSRIYLRDSRKDVEFTVLTERSQGGASIHDGQLELMVHRRMYVDDHYGVGEPLNETGIGGKGLVIRGKHFLMLNTVQESQAHHRQLAEHLFMEPVLTVAPLTTSIQQYTAAYKTLWSGLKRSLPDNVHLLTMEQWTRDTFLLRLEHIYEKDDHPVLSKPATVSLKGLFVPFDVASVVELTLGGNEPLNQATRLQWNVENHGRTGAKMSDYVKPVSGSTLDVTLEPMQIRTFQVSIESH